MTTEEKKVVVEELHAPARQRYRRRRVIVKFIGDLWQGDLVEMIPYARDNKGYKYILMVIDAFSKFLHAKPLKSKTGKEVTEAMRRILKTQKPPVNFQTDAGKEFFNAEFSGLMKRRGINHYATYSNLKASIVERVNRTIKNKMWKRFSLQGTYKWVSMLPELIRDYNHTMHRTIGMKPAEVTKKDERRLKKDVYTYIKQVAPAHFKVGDHVRISRRRHAFTKGYTPNWTTEVFAVREVQRTNPTTYLLRDYRGEPIMGGFYREELQKAKQPDVYLVEKVLRRKGNKVFVKWLGMDKSHNSWINK